MKESNSNNIYDLSKAELLNLQKSFESGKITEEQMTPDQRMQLISLYKLQVRGLDDETYNSYKKFEEINL